MRAASPVRPRIGSGMKKHWDALVGYWAASDLLFVRRSGLRGNLGRCEFVHGQLPATRLDYCRGQPFPQQSGMADRKKRS